MLLPLSLGEQSYDIILERGALKKAGELLSLDSRVLVVTDSGVPTEYAECLAAQCADATVITLESGEQSKSFDNYRMLLSHMLKSGFTRTDCVVAVGGGVVGDLSGFAASSYMRGIDFCNIPTTLLSQVDSSIGGKVAIDFEGVKNVVGAFYQPKRVLIDPDLLATLDSRQLHAGLAEAIKMSVTCDSELFEKIEASISLESDIEEIIERSLRIKRAIVERDEKETGLRRVLNFGHTVGHAIESFFGGRLLHGECVALGMLPMCSIALRKRVSAVLQKYDLPTSVSADAEALMDYIVHDKKADADSISVVLSCEPGTFEMKKIKLKDMREYVDSLLHC